MGSSPEVEKFEITEDDLTNEFNPFRRTFQQSKNQATYGIWADDESDEDTGGRPSFGGGRKRVKDYTAPVSFVSGGVKVGDSLEKKEGVDAISDSDDEAPPVEQPTYGKQRGRPTFQGSAFKKLPGASGNSALSGPSAGGRGSIGSWEAHTKGIGKKLMQKMGYKEGTGIGKTLQGISTPVEANLRKGRAAIGFYGSERTERSLKDFPTQPDSEEEDEQQFKEKLHQWKKVGAEKKPKKVQYQYKTVDEVIASGGKRRTVVQSELSKVKVIDMTGREKRVLSGYHAISNKHDKPEEEEAFETAAQGKRAFDMPELLHNLDLLVEMAEDEILRNNKKLQYESDLVITLQYEGEKLDKGCENEKIQIEKLKNIMSMINECDERLAPDAANPLDLEECATLFTRLQEEFYEEYKIYDLASLGIALVFPLLKKELENWEPLRQPQFGFEMMQQWKDILEGPSRSFGAGEAGQQTDPYERLLWEVWMPHLRNTINAKWSVRNCDPLVELLELWVPLLPTWMLYNTLEQIVPRLQAEVTDWNPLTDTMPIHSWLHPWLPLMGERLEPLYGPIRHKLANALTNWHPSDPSAKMILQPWVTVFKKGHTEAFLVKNIAPKLALCLQEFIINPHQQHLDAWNYVMDWIDMLPVPAMVAVLEKSFFPRWHQVLCSWLASNPDYEEVTKWYTGWKTMIPEVLCSQPAIKGQLNRALCSMNQAASGTMHAQPGARENMAYLSATERRTDYGGTPGYGYQTPAPPPPPPVDPKMDYENRGARSGNSSSVPTSFKELIEKRLIRVFSRTKVSVFRTGEKRDRANVVLQHRGSLLRLKLHSSFNCTQAEDNNILFMPLVGKTFEAKQVYLFGRLHISIDRGVIFLQSDQGMWAPVSLQTIVDRAR